MGEARLGLPRDACDAWCQSRRGKSSQGGFVETIFDWLTLAVFTGLVVLLLQRSAQEEPSDHLWQYAPPAIGCAVVNYVGNEGYSLIAAVGLVAVLVYIYYVLKPRIGV